MSERPIPRIVGNVESFPPGTRVRIGECLGTVEGVWTIGSHLVLFDGAEEPEVVEKFRMQKVDGEGS